MHYDLDLQPFDPKVTTCANDPLGNDSHQVSLESMKAIKKLVQTIKFLVTFFGWTNRQKDKLTNRWTPAPNSMPPYPLRGGGDNNIYWLYLSNLGIYHIIFQWILYSWVHIGLCCIQCVWTCQQCQCNKRKRQFKQLSVWFSSLLNCVLLLNWNIHFL